MRIITSPSMMIGVEWLNGKSRYFIMCEVTYTCMPESIKLMIKSFFTTHINFLLIESTSKYCSLAIV